jgi:hypothetical protein
LDNEKGLFLASIIQAETRRTLVVLHQAAILQLVTEYLGVITDLSVQGCLQYCRCAFA